MIRGLNRAFVLACWAAAAHFATASGAAAQAGPPGPAELARPVSSAPLDYRQRGDRLLLSTESFATNATAALAASRLATLRVARALEALGRADVRVRVLEPQLLPRYEREGIVRVRTGLDAERPRLVGYLAIGELLVESGRAEQLGLLLDVAAGAGATLVEHTPTPAR